jgi:hypothetical protein
MYSWKTGIQVTMAIVSPGRMGVGWETMSLIEGKRLKRDRQALDQRERKKADFSLIFCSLFNYATQRSSK